MAGTGAAIPRGPVRSLTMTRGQASHGVDHAILVSSFGVSERGAPTLGLLDPHTHAFRFLDLPYDRLPGSAMAGLTSSDRYLFAAVRAIEKRDGRVTGVASTLLVLDRD